MKFNFKAAALKGLKRSPNNPKTISKMGYRDDSPYRNEPYLDIHTPNGQIDMSQTGIDLMANGRFLPAYSGMHQFDSNVVREVPLHQNGGPTPTYQDSLALYNYTQLQKKLENRSDMYKPSFWERVSGDHPRLNSQGTKDQSVLRAEVLKILKNNPNIKTGLYNVEKGLTRLGMSDYDAAEGSYDLYHPNIKPQKDWFGTAVNNDYSNVKPDPKIEIPYPNKSVGTGMTRTISKNVTLKPDPKIVSKQQQLIDAGYNIGTADGLWGPKSQAAWNKFQQQKEEERLAKERAQYLKETTPLTEESEEGGIKYETRGMQKTQTWVPNPNEPGGGHYEYGIPSENVPVENNAYQDGGEIMELTDEEIEAYRAQGYEVDEVMQGGDEVTDKASDFQSRIMQLSPNQIQGIEDFKKREKEKEERIKLELEEYKNKPNEPYVAEASTTEVQKPDVQINRDISPEEFTQIQAENKVRDAAQKKQQEEFEKAQWEKYDDASMLEAGLDRAKAFAVDPAGMTSRFLTGQQAYIPGMGDGLMNPDSPEYENYMKAIGRNPNEFNFAAEVQNLVNPGYWGASIGNNINKGNYGTAALEGAMTFAPFIPKGTGRNLVNSVKQGSRMLADDAARLGNHLTTQTPLKNTYKYNPYRFEPDPTMLYRGLGKEGAEDALQSGVFRPNQNVKPNIEGGFNLAKDFNTTQAGTYYSPYFDVADTDGKGFIAEGPRDAATFGKRYKGKDWSLKTKEQIPIEKGKVLKKDWLKGYKEIPNPKNIPNPQNISNNTPRLSDAVKELTDNPNFHKLGFYAKRDEIMKYLKSEEGIKRMTKLVDDNPHLSENFKRVTDHIEDFGKMQFETKKPLMYNGSYIKNKDGKIEYFNVDPDNAYSWYRDGYNNPSYISVGKNFTPYDASHIFEHEFAHTFQRGNELVGIDDELGKITLNSNKDLAKKSIKDFVKDVNPFSKKVKGDKYSNTSKLFELPSKKPLLKQAGLKNAKDYWLKGAGRGQEKYAFAAEVRENLLQNGIIKNRYDDITPEMLEKHYKLYNNIKGDNKYKLRLYEIMKNDKNNFKTLSEVMNKMPAVVPVVGVGAAAASSMGDDSNVQPSMQTGGAVYKGDDVNQFRTAESKGDGTIYVSDPNDPRIQAYNYMQSLLEEPNVEAAKYRKASDEFHKYVAELKADTNMSSRERSDAEYEMFKKLNLRELDSKAWAEERAYNNRFQFRHYQHDDTVEIYEPDVPFKTFPGVEPTYKKINNVEGGEHYYPFYPKVKYADPEVVAKQQQLAEAGLYNGAFDGIWGPKSQAGWETLQQQNEEKRIAEEKAQYIKETTPLTEKSTEGGIEYETRGMGTTEVWNPETQSFDKKPIIKNIPVENTAYEKGGEFMEMELTDLEIAELKRQGYEIEDLP